MHPIFLICAITVEQSGLGCAIVWSPRLAYPTWCLALLSVAGRPSIQIESIEVRNNHTFQVGNKGNRKSLPSRDHHISCSVYSNARTVALDKGVHARGDFGVFSCRLFLFEGCPCLFPNFASHYFLFKLVDQAAPLVGCQLDKATHQKKERDRRHGTTQKWQLKPLKAPVS